MFVYNTEIQLHHTDAAGVLFFSHQFTLAHDAYQAFMQDLGLPLAHFIEKADYFLPIVHAESDFKLPLRVGKKIKIKLMVNYIGQSSFILHYALFDEAGSLCGEVKTVHVCMDRTNHRKMDLPAEVREKLKRYTTGSD